MQGADFHTHSLIRLDDSIDGRIQVLLRRWQRTTTQLEQTQEFHRNVSSCCIMMEKDDVENEGSVEKESMPLFPPQ